MINSDNLCMGCMKEIGDLKQCPHCGFDADSKQIAGFLPIRTVIANRYLIGRLLDFNGEGATYLSLDLFSRKSVNVREFYPGSIVQRDINTNKISPMAGNEALYLELKQDFAELWGKIMRLNGLSALIKAEDVIEENGTCYAVTERVGGMTLRDYLLKSSDAGNLTWERARPLLMPVLSTLGTLHSAGIIHRGISPSTLLVGADGKIRISGFCISAVRSEHASLKSEIFPGYAAYEQYGFETQQGPWTDIYAFGAVLYRTLIGSDPIDAKERISNDRLMIPGRLAEQLPAYVINGLINSLQILPADRAKSAEELRNELSAAPGAAAAAAPPQPPRSEPVRQRPPVQADDSAQKIAQAQRRRKRSTMLLIIGAIVIIVAVTLIAVFFINGNKSNNADNGASQTQELVETPSLTGLNYEDIIADRYYSANFTFEKKEKYSDDIAEGQIISQNVAPGTQIPKMTKIVLTVSKGVEYVQFPKDGIIGADFNTAKSILEKAGFVVSKIDKDNYGGNAKNTVDQASCDGGQRYPKGTKVDLIVWTDVITTTTTTTTTEAPDYPGYDDDDDSDSGTSRTRSTDDGGNADFETDYN